MKKENFRITHFYYIVHLLNNTINIESKKEERKNIVIEYIYCVAVYHSNICLPKSFLKSRRSCHVDDTILFLTESY